jgi:hypothetical protein
MPQQTALFVEMTGLLTGAPGITTSSVASGTRFSDQLPAVCQLVLVLPCHSLVCAREFNPHALTIAKRIINLFMVMGFGK